MIKLVVGLGNPGQKYQQTRHNVGFLLLDRMVGAQWPWLADARFDAWIASPVVDGKKTSFLKPCTFMNRSGNAVGKFARYYKLLADEILVVHDELDFAVGVAKFKQGGGHAGHNGLRDIIAHLGSGDFYRLRVGIGRPAVGAPVADYVLSPPAADEWPVLQQVFSLCEGAVREAVVGDVGRVVARQLNIV